MTRSTGERRRFRGGRHTRREFLGVGAAMAAAAFVTGAGASRSAPPADHPRLYLTTGRAAGLRSVEDVRSRLHSPHARGIWERILAEAHQDLEAVPLLPSSVFPGRNLSAARHKNADWTICNAVGQRMLRASLASLLTEKRAYVEVALRQMEALFDTRRWPAWLDQAHERFGHPAGLRTGMLAHDVALAYDWLHAMLSESERAEVLDGITRRGIRPYLESLAQDPWWTHDLNNWLTVIVGGFGIAGMALDGDHPDAGQLLQTALPQMKRYLTIYGPDGEFNESVAYANATKLPVGFFLAHQYWAGEPRSPLASHPFPATCRWLICNTLPPGRVAAFGDSHPEAAPEVRYVAAVAAATGDGILQWFYRTHARASADPLELLWHDPALEPVSPEGRLPRARFYQAHGATMSSRTDWSAGSTPSVVYGKAGREENHEHNDIGQLCIDGYGERLIVDLGSPSAYPADFFEHERWEYYNASIRGHNIIMISGRELRSPKRERGTRPTEEERGWTGRFVSAWQDDTLGASWTMDTTPAYEDAELVRRHVVHLLPDVVAVVDDVRLPAPAEISLRWHTIDRCQPDEQGAFLVRGSRAWAAARVVRLDRGTIRTRRAEHTYRPPFDRDRMGEPLEERRESFVEAVVTDAAWRVLSLFAVGPVEEDPRPWMDAERGWRFQGQHGTVEVRAAEELLSACNMRSGAEISHPM